MKKINVESSKRNEMIDITSKVKNVVSESPVKDGECVIYCPHTTAAITINENADPAVKEDITNVLTKIIPNINFKHMEGNSDSHLKSSLIGCSERVLIEDGKMQLGRWQGIMFCEFDGPRNRNVWIKIIEK